MLTLQSASVVTEAVKGTAARNAAMAEADRQAEDAAAAARARSLAAEAAAAEAARKAVSAEGRFWKAQSHALATDVKVEAGAAWPGAAARHQPAEAAIPC